MEIEIGRAKSGRRAWGFDDIAIVPSRRTRDPEDVSLEWELDAFTFQLPMMASGMDSAVTPATAIEIGRLGGLACLNLEGLWTRYEDPIPVYEEIAELDKEKATRRMQEMYATPVIPNSSPACPGDQGCGCHRCGSLTPDCLQVHRLRQGWRSRRSGDPGHRGVGRARVLTGGAARSVQVHPRRRDARDRRWVRQLLGSSAPDAHRCGRCPRRRRSGCRMHDARRSRYRSSPGDGDRRRRRGAVVVSRGDRTLRPRHRRRRHANRRRRIQGHRLWRRRRDARIADGCRRGVPFGGYHWGMATFHPTLPRDRRVQTGTLGTFEEILLGPAHENDGRRNLFGGLRGSMATTGYATVKEFQKAEVMVAPALQTEGKQLQRSQGVGMG